MSLRFLKWIIALAGVLCLALASCHPATTSQPMAAQAKAEKLDGSQPDIIKNVRTLSGEEQADMQKFFPVSRYKGFPAEVQVLMQREDFEHDICRGRSDLDGGRGQRSCDAEGPITDALEAKGYCWGGSFYTIFQYWLKCKEDPTLRPDYTDPTFQPLQPLPRAEHPIMQRRFPAAGYRAFPVAFRREMQRADYEADLCSHFTYADGARGMAHCIAESVAKDRLRERQWCLKDNDARGASNWKKCEGT